MTVIDVFFEGIANHTTPYCLLHVLLKQIKGSSSFLYVHGWHQIGDIVH